MSPDNGTQKAGDTSPAFSVDGDPFGRRDTPAYSLSLWPNRSLSPTGARRVLIFVGIGLAIPLVPFLGTPVAWGLLPFLVGALIALYAALRRSYADGRLHEELRLWNDLITVERVEPGGRVQRWHANPYWVTTHLKDTRRVESYLTLKGNGREIELGAFLSPDERVALYDELSAALRRIGPAHT